MSMKLPDCQVCRALREDQCCNAGLRELPVRQERGNLACQEALWLWTSLVPQRTSMSGGISCSSTSAMQRAPSSRCALVTPGRSNAPRAMHRCAPRLLQSSTSRCHVEHSEGMDTVISTRNISTWSCCNQLRPLGAQAAQVLCGSNAQMGQRCLSQAAVRISCHFLEKL